MTHVVAAIPGRIRVRDRLLAQGDRLERLREAAATRPGVTAVRTNPGSGSLVVHYDAARVAPEAMEKWLENRVDRELHRPLPRSGRSRRMAINRAAKATMLASLAATLALAATGNKRGHTLAGLGFVSALAVHLAVHRHHLLR